MAFESLEHRTLLSGMPSFDHVVVLLEENHPANGIYGNVDAPYLNSLATGGAKFTQSFGIAHPSQPNYLALFSGSTQGVTTDLPSTFSTPNLDTQLKATSRSFKGYVEAPSVRHHNPWESFTNAATDEADISAFPSDFNQLPTVSFVVPNLANDMHNGTVATADTWAKTHLDAYAQWAKTHNSLLIVTWDEDDKTAANNISTIFYGASIYPSTYNEHIDHYNVLRTIEDGLGLTPLGSAATASPITDVFNPPVNVFVDSGGGAVGSFSADGSFSGGATYATTAPIVTTGVTNPPPAKVFQSERYGNFTYTITGRAPGSPYDVRLDFAEIYYSVTGARIFNTKINGTQVLTNFDIFAAAGGKNVVVAKTFATTADANGIITINFTSVKDSAKVSGIEVTAGGIGVQTLTTVNVSPSSANVAVGSKTQFIAKAYDQFGNAMLAQPAFDWSLDSTVPGSITSVNSTTELFTAASAGSTVIHATPVGGSVSGAASIVVHAAVVTPVAIDSGGGVVGNFVADTGFTGGNTFSTTSAVNVTGVANAAPAAAYKTERYGNFSYVVGGRTPGATYTVRLHFAEIYYAAANLRLFNVKINGVQLLTNFDVFANAHGKNIALVKSFTATADNSGNITIGFVSVKDSAKVSAIEVV